ncbi:hypothetical protein HDU84_001213 [Entophlyctis sp. JEL0112]|nr:hypothetical protein HDU84_001213 [Entophlyctis sp. JEL0112]
MSLPLPSLLPSSPIGLGQDPVTNPAHSFSWSQHINAGGNSVGNSATNTAASAKPLKRPTLENVFARLRSSPISDAVDRPENDFLLLREIFSEWSVPDHTTILGGGGMGIVYSKDTRVRQIILNHSEDQPIQLTCELSPAIANLTSLALLQLSNHQLHGSLPHEIGCLVNLRELALPGNMLSGPIPDSITALTLLEVLDLHDNQFSAPLPIGFFSALRRLSVLRLNGNMLTGGIPEEIGLVKGLTQLYLGHNRMDGPLPKAFGSLTKLELM